MTSQFSIRGNTEMKSIKTIIQAGAVVYKKSENKIQFLLIKSSKDAAKWVFPKGHIEAGETEEQTATRELEEEAGIIGRVISYLGMIEFEFENKYVKVKYYLHEFVKENGPGEPNREPKWYSVEEATEKISFKDSEKLIEKALKMIN